MHTLHCTTISNQIYSFFFLLTISLSWHFIFSESDLLLELEFELINSTSGSNLWHWNTLARHLNFLVPSQVRAPLLELSYTPYYPEVQAACSGATAAPGAGHYQQCTPPGYVNATTMNCCVIAIPTKCVIKWPHPQLVLLLKVLYLLTEPCKKSDFFS